MLHVRVFYMAITKTNSHTWVRDDISRPRVATSVPVYCDYEHNIETHMNFQQSKPNKHIGPHLTINLIQNLI